MNNINIPAILELKAELEARMREFEVNPEAGYSWDQVKSRLQDGSWRSA